MNLLWVSMIRFFGIALFLVPYFVGMLLSWVLLPQWLSLLCALPWFYVCGKLAAYLAWKLGLTEGPQ